jgi:hypothetical protein
MEKTQLSAQCGGENISSQVEKHFKPGGKERMIR